MGDDIYIADDGLEEDCLDPKVIGYIQITSAAPPHFLVTPRGSTLVGIAVPRLNSSTPGLRPLMEMVTWEKPPATRALVPPAAVLGPS